jgi:hypothetical protein
MAPTADAEVVLKLYELRREPELRKARAFIGLEFKPESLEDVQKVQRGAGTDENRYWRQVISYWEMAAALVLRGAVDPELFCDVNGEGIFVYAKFHRFFEESEKTSGTRFMPRTAELIATVPAAKAAYDRLKAMQAAQRKS